MFDLTSQEFKDRPFDTLSEMNRVGPIVWGKLPIIGRVRFVTTYSAVDEVLRDHHRFVRESSNAGGSRFAFVLRWLSWMFSSISENMLAKDEPDHRRLRGLVESAFLRRSVEDMRDRIRQLAEQILDECLAEAEKNRSDSIDFMNFSRQFPLAVICELMGLPAQDRAKFTQWAAGISTVNSLGGLLLLIPNMLRVASYFRAFFRQCRDKNEESQDSLLSLLVKQQEDGDQLSENELTAMAFLLLFAGHETTTHLISGSLLTLIEEDEQREWLVNHWDQAEMAVDELLRFNSPVQFTKPRLAATAMTFHGESIPRGNLLMPLIAAANADSKVFEQPQQLNLQRSPNPHLGFGSGIHVCLGLKLARIETAIALRTVFDRFPNVKLGVARTDLRWNQRIGIRGMRNMPIQVR